MARCAMLALLALLALAACKPDSTSNAAPSDDAGTDPGAGPAITPPAGSGDAFCDKTLGALVGALESCCTTADKSTSEYRLTHGLAAALLPECKQALDASISKGRVLYRAQAADACFAAYAKTYAPGACANITQTYSDPAGASCRDAFSGTGAAGAPCGGDQECQDGLSCVGYSNAADGTCRAPGALGDACGALRADAGATISLTLEFGTHPACVTGARCDSFARVCVAADAGAPSDVGGPCTSQSDCKPGTFCETKSGTCAAKRAAGGACTESSFETECLGRCDADAGAAGTCVSFCGSP